MEGLGGDAGGRQVQLDSAACLLGGSELPEVTGMQVGAQARGAEERVLLSPAC